MYRRRHRSVRADGLLSRPTILRPVTDPIYDRSVPFYDDMFAFKDYAGETDYLVEVIRRRHRSARSSSTWHAEPGDISSIWAGSSRSRDSTSTHAFSTSHVTDSQGSRFTRRT